MILVLARIGDEGARTLVDELKPLCAAAVTCLDFITAPSSLRYPDFDLSMVTVGTRALRATEITGVVNALPAVSHTELVAYDPAERGYQAAELHAWLVYFLAALRCPVLNRPSALSLAGSPFGVIGWLQLAREIGIPFAPSMIDSGDAGTPVSGLTPGRYRVTWAEGLAVGTDAESRTAALAHAAGVGYLAAWYDDADRFVGASTLPDLASATTRRLLVGALATCARTF